MTIEREGTIIGILVGVIVFICILIIINGGTIKQENEIGKQTILE